MTRILSILAVVALLMITSRAAGFLLLAILAVTYGLFCIGLALIFRRLGLPGIIGLIPLYNYYYMIKKIGLPGRWFFLSMVPVLSPIYAVGIMGRLGKIFHRSLPWSMFWLTLGAPFGVFKVALDDRQPKLELMHEPVPTIDSLKNDILKMKASKDKSKVEKTKVAAKA